VSILAILILGVLILFVAWALRGGSGRPARHGGVILGGLVIAGTLVALFALGFALKEERQRATAVAEQERMRAEVESAERRAMAQATGAEPAWSSEVEQRFEADLYPSQKSAAEALARRLADRLPEVIGSGELKPVLNVRGDLPTEVFMAAERILREGIERRSDATASKPAWAEPLSVHGPLPGETKSATRPAATRPAQVVHVRAVIGLEGQEQLRMEIEGPGKAVVAYARFVDKPWVEDFPAYAGRPENAGRVLSVARSRQLCGTREEAYEEAIEQGVSNVQRDVGKALCMEMGIRQWPPPGRYHEATWPREEIRAMIQGTHSVCREAGGRALRADMFTQEFRRPYGKVYRTAVLLDLSPAHWTRVTSYFRCVTANHMANRRNTLLAVAGLAAVILVVYLFLNAATKGYYVWALRATAVVAVIAGVVVLLHVA